MIGYGYDEGFDSASTEYTMTAEEISAYNPSSVTVAFWAYEGSSSSFDELTIEY